MDEPFEIRGYRTDKFGVSLYCESCRVDNNLTKTTNPTEGVCIYCGSHTTVYKMTCMLEGNKILDAQKFGRRTTILETWEEKNIRRGKY